MIKALYDFFTTKALVGLFFSVMVLDQSSKILILRIVKKGQVITLSSFLDIVIIFNYGISFGLLKSAGMLGIWIFSIIALGICVFLLKLIADAKTIYEKQAYALIIGGALSNVIDRLVYGGVVDFLYFHYHSHYWPAFNVADAAIVSGCGLIFIINMWQPKFMKNSRQKPRKKS